MTKLLFSTTKGMVSPSSDYCDPDKSSLNGGLEISLNRNSREKARRRMDNSWEDSVNGSKEQGQ